MASRGGSRRRSKNKDKRAVKKEARQEKRAVKKDKRAVKKEARQEKRDERKEERKEKRAARKDGNEVPKPSQLKRDIKKSNKAYDKRLTELLDRAIKRVERAHDHKEDDNTHLKNVKKSLKTYNDYETQLTDSKKDKKGSLTENESIQTTERKAIQKAKDDIAKLKKRVKEEKNTRDEADKKAKKAKKNINKLKKDLSTIEKQEFQLNKLKIDKLPAALKTDITRQDSMINAACLHIKNLIDTHKKNGKVGSTDLKDFKKKKWNKNCGTDDRSGVVHSTVKW